MSEWVLIIRGIQATPDQLQQALHRIHDTLGLPCTGTITIAEWAYQAQVQLKRPTTADSTSLVGTRPRPKQQ